MQKPFNPLAKLANQHSRHKSVISLTPLIDVVFILLIFFMLTSSFLDWHTLSLDTSTATTPATPVEQTPFVVQLHEDEITLNGEAISLDALVEKAQSRQPAEQPVSLQPMQATLVQRVIKVLDALNAADIQPLKLVDDPEWQVTQVQSYAGEN